MVQCVCVCVVGTRVPLYDTTATLGWSFRCSQFAGVPLQQYTLSYAPDGPLTGPSAVPDSTHTCSCSSVPILNHFCTHYSVMECLFLNAAAVLPSENEEMSELWVCLEFAVRSVFGLCVTRAAKAELRVRKRKKVIWKVHKRYLTRRNRRRRRKIHWSRSVFVD